MPVYTRAGLKKLAALIADAQAERRLSDREFSEIVGINPTSIGALKKAWVIYPDNRQFADATLKTLAPHLPIPFSDKQDPVTLVIPQRLYFNVYELRAVVEGWIPLRITEDDPPIPFTEALERVRAERGHSYEQMCELAHIGAERAEAIRRLLLLGGWGENHAQATGDIFYLGEFYFGDVERLLELRQQSQTDPAVNGSH
ncbi:MAG TPA: hypothetical protein V6D06_01450 [Trichocoleus sp.]